MRCEVRRTEQALLFQGPANNGNRPLRLGVCKGLSQFQYARHAHAVVDGAVVDLVDSGDIRLDPEMIPVRGEQDVRVWMFDTGYDADDIACLEVREVGMGVRVERRAV